MSNPPSAPRSAAEVLKHHLQAFAAGDLEAMVADYAADAVMITPRGNLCGQSAIRPVLAEIVEEFRHPQATFTLRHQSAHGDVAYMVWEARTARRIYHLGTDTLLVRQGRIVAQTYAGYSTPLP